MGNNLKAIMKVMRFASRRGQSYYNQKSMITKDLYPIMHYKMKKLTPYSIYEKLDLQSIIPMCSLDTFDSPEVDILPSKRAYYNCSLFEPVFTDIGMCHSYNPMPVVDIIRPSYYTEAFKEAYADDLRPNTTIHMGVDRGDSITFYLYGNFHRKMAMSLDMGKYVMPKATAFFFSITNKLEYFGMKNVRKEIKGGYKTIWKIQAMEIEPSDDLRSLDVESRKCRFADETDGLEIFGVYTKTGCDFEQSVKQAQGICNCVPWYIPWHTRSRYSICDFNGNRCFKSFMKVNGSLLEEKCLPNCHEIQFTSAEVLEKLNPDDFCSEDVFHSADFDSKPAYDVSEDKTMMMKIRAFFRLGKYDLVDQVWKMKESLIGPKENVTIEGIKKELCIQLVKNDLAKVKIMFERPKYMKTSTSLKVTFPDKLGAFGND